jgi:prepilin peptidase CpaA
MKRMLIEFFPVGMVTLAAIFDLMSRRIPNALVAAGLVAALFLHVFLPAGGGWKVWMLGMLTGFGVFLPFYVLRGMAAGDVKLMAAVGSFVGPHLAFKIALATFVIGGAWSLFVIVYKGKIRDTWINLRALMAPVLMRIAGMPAQSTGMQKESVGRLPYAVAIALGTLTILFFGGN